jgi:Response regulator containing a CheY-like receiver domain and a GGDEF domain
VKARAVEARKVGAAVLQTHREARVLIVDDYSDTALLLQRLLARNGLEHLYVATDPRTVIDELPKLQPDLVLLDLYMPYIDGYTLLRRIREWAAEEYLPVVIMTADVRAETLLRAINDGATDFLTKPFNATEILIRVRNLLQSRSLYLALHDRVRPACSTTHS